MRRTTVVVLVALALLPASVSVQTSRDQAAQGAPSDAKPSTHPKRFALIRVAVDGDARVVDTGALKKLKLTIAEAGTREFRVTVAEPLEPCEYAFFVEDQGKGGTPAQIWAFTKAGG